MEGDRSGEGLATVTEESGEGVETLGISVLRLAIGEAGSASEPAPVGGARVCAEPLGKGLRGKGAKLLRKGLGVAKPCLEAPGTCLDDGGGAVVFSR